MAKIVIGIQTCNRLHFTKELIDSLLKHNPELIKFPWVIYDDASVDDTQNYLQSLDFIDIKLFSAKQLGITKGLEFLIYTASRMGDVILYLQNDWKLIRSINFNAVSNFYDMYPNAGHIGMIVNKGTDSHKRISAFGKKLNLFTKKTFEPGPPIKIDSEIFIPGDWTYADIPGFTRLKFALQMFDGIHYGQGAEAIRVKNIYKSRCDNYLLDNQPFINLDWNSRTPTPRRHP